MVEIVPLVTNVVGSTQQQLLKVMLLTSIQTNEKIETLSESLFLSLS